MNIIELERWEPNPEDPRRRQYAGQRVAQEVFEELKHRLESTGYLPDEYFLLNHEWENGRKIPEDADIYCATDYGGSEGVYLDVYLKWREKDGTPVGNLAQRYSGSAPNWSWAYCRTASLTEQEVSITPHLVSQWG